MPGRGGRRFARRDRFGTSARPTHDQRPPKQRVGARAAMRPAGPRRSAPGQVVRHHGAAGGAPVVSAGQRLGRSRDRGAAAGRPTAPPRPANHPSHGDHGDPARAAAHSGRPLQAAGADRAPRGRAYWRPDDGSRARESDRRPCSGGRSAAPVRKMPTAISLSENRANIELARLPTSNAASMGALSL